MAANYCHKSSEGKNMWQIFDCGKTPLRGESILFNTTSTSKFLQLFSELFCQQLEKHQKSPFTLTTRIQNNMSNGSLFHVMITI